VKNLLKFTALVSILGLLAFGCSQTDDTALPTGPNPGILTSALNGSETLGDPVGLTVASGTGVVAAGEGLFKDLDGPIAFNVPAGVTVKQVILYWEGQHKVAAGDAAIKVNGNTVNGNLIGGPNFFYTPYSSSSYRADITGLGLVAPGANTLNITDMRFDDKNSGAGVVVIYQESGEPAATIMLKDGNDLAFRDFVEPRKSCVPQTFTFGAAMVDRAASVSFFMGSISAERPSILRWWIDGVAQPDVCDAFSAPNDGPEWVTLTVPITIPANATSVKFEPVSAACAGTAYPGKLPQSFAWVAAALSIEGVPGGEGCTPGYWKNTRMHWCAWDVAGYSPTDDFDTVFGTNYFNPDRTLLVALQTGGGGYDALGRHAVAALLSASHAGVDYGLTVQQVIDAVKAGDKDLLAGYNEMGCPLGNCK
jgi:hypothetical protein